MPRRRTNARLARKGYKREKHDDDKPYSPDFITRNCLGLIKANIDRRLGLKQGNILYQELKSSINEWKKKFGKDRFWRLPKQGGETGTRDVISHKVPKASPRWSRKFVIEQPKCQKIAMKYIKNKKDCIMFHQMKDECLHECIYEESSHHFQIHTISYTDFFPWVGEVDQTPNTRFCSDCMTALWSNSDLILSLLTISSEFGASTCGLTMKYMHMLADYSTHPLIGKQKVTLEHFKRMRLFYDVIKVTNVWHCLMINPYFIRYHLLKNKKLFCIFLQYWNSMSAVVSDRDFYDGVFGPSIDITGDRPPKEHFMQSYLHYLISKYNDISYCFYSMMHHLKKKHLDEKYLGYYVNWIMAKVGSENVLYSTDYYLAILNLIWRKLTAKYQAYNLDISKFAMRRLIALPVEYPEDTILDKKIRKKLMNAVKCGNFDECKQTIMNHKVMKLCSNCKMIAYCSKHCQKRSWKRIHRSVCSKIKMTFTKINKMFV